MKYKWSIKAGEKYIERITAENTEPTDREYLDIKQDWRKSNGKTDSLKWEIIAID
jgi:hypothetical protein